MDNNYPHHSTDIRSMKIIHVAMLAGQIIFGAIVLYLICTGRLEKATTGSNTIFKYLVPALALGAFAAGYMLFRKLIGVAKAVADLGEKLSLYRGALITRYALLEGCSLFAIIASLLTGNLIYLVISGVIVLFFMTLGPKKERIVAELELSTGEELILTGRE